MADQNQKSFQKQDAIFVGKKRVLGKKGKGGNRYVRKSIGLGFKTPKAAIEGTYVDKKCPFTGNVSIRGRILKGLVISTKMQRRDKKLSVRRGGAEREAAAPADSHRRSNLIFQRGGMDRDKILIRC